MAYSLCAIIFSAYHVLFIGSDFDFNNPIVLLQKVIYIANGESGALIFFLCLTVLPILTHCVWWCLIPAHFSIITPTVQYHSLIKTLLGPGFSYNRLARMCKIILLRNINCICKMHHCE